jgi:bifunctional UDP-N-acetylglucosamine pyrophosphorylase/glucosamine-1-phosphate N-acetyltransferase
MKAVILAAGEGQRMRPLTLTTPKPLLKINGRAILEYVFDALPPEIDEAIVVVKYLGEQIRKFLGSEFHGRKIFFAEGSDKGTAYSFLAAKPFFKNQERFLFLYGDELPNPQDVKNCLKKEFGVVMFRSERPQANGIAALRADGTIEEIIEKLVNPKSNLAADGIMVLNARAFDYQPQANAKGEYYFTSIVNQFVKDFPVWPVETAGFIGDISAPEDLVRVEKLLG